MKKKFLTLCLAVALALGVKAQAPQAFNYQGIARTTTGTALVNTPLKLRLSVIDGTEQGQVVYTETHEVSTNAYGLYNVHIGEGTALQGNFAAIPWQLKNKYIKVELDANDGNGLVDLGTTQLLSVPYALYAKKSGDAANAVTQDQISRAGTANYLSKFDASGSSASTINSNIYDVGSTPSIGLNTSGNFITPEANTKFQINRVTNGAYLIGRNTLPTGIGFIRLLNDDATKFATLTKYGSGVAGGYPGIASLYPYANIFGYGNNGPVLNAATGNMGFAVTTGGTNRLKIHIDAATLRLGLGGNAVPQQLVHINSTDAGVDANLKITSNNSGHATADGFEIRQNSANNIRLTNMENAAVLLGTNNIDRMIVTKDGLVGVSNIAPTGAQLEVSTNSTLTVTTVESAILGTGRQTGVQGTATIQNKGFTKNATSNIWTPPYFEAIGVLGKGLVDLSLPATPGQGNGNSIGVAGTSTNNTNVNNNIGVMGEAGFASGYNTGVEAIILDKTGTQNAGIRATAPTEPNNFAGLFNGNVRVGNTANSSYRMEVEGSGTPSVQDGLHVIGKDIIATWNDNQNPTGAFGIGSFNTSSNDNSSYGSYNISGAVSSPSASTQIGALNLGYGGDMSAGSYNIGDQIGLYATASRATMAFSPTIAALGINHSVGVQGDASTTDGSLAIGVLGTSVTPNNSTSNDVNLGMLAEAGQAKDVNIGIYAKVNPQIDPSINPENYGIYASTLECPASTATPSTAPLILNNSAIVGVSQSLTNNIGTAWNGDYAGYFYGDVNITNSLNAVYSTAGTKAFTIDHPLDPKNKILRHSSVESPDMMNIYNGNITTDANGKAVVTLPAYFEALNAEFRYQLTVIDATQFAQARISKQITGNTFEITTDKPSISISWQVTGIRHDALAAHQPIIVESNKTPEAQGTYLHPFAFADGNKQVVLPNILSTKGKANNNNARGKHVAIMEQAAAMRKRITSSKK
jgi:hypothetical protein